MNLDEALHNSTVADVHVSLECNEYHREDPKIQREKLCISAEKNYRPPTLVAPEFSGISPPLPTLGT